MVYSCFDDKTGLYNYFEDQSKRPINADLPVPSYLSRRATKLGTPATEAGRPLPTDAVPAGSGWQARGMIVQCDARGFAGVGFGTEMEQNVTGRLAFGALLVGVGGLLIWSNQALSGTVVGGLGVWALMSG